MSKTLTKADIVEAIYEKTDKNRAEVKNWWKSCWTS
jgi:integration host factor subunit alpha